MKRRERPIDLEAPLIRALLERRAIGINIPLDPTPPPMGKVYKQSGDTFKISPATWMNRPNEFHVCGPVGVTLKEAGLPNDYHWRCPLGAPEDRLWVREAFWAKHDQEIGDYGAIYFNAPVLDCEPPFNPGWDYCATPEYLDPPKPPDDRGRPFLPHDKAEPGDWWLSPPDNWDGTEEGRESGSWVFLPWGEEGHNYTSFPAAEMPRWMSRLLLKILEVRVHHDELPDQWAWKVVVKPIFTNRRPGRFERRHESVEK